MGSNERTFKYSIFTIQIFSIFSFLMLHFSNQILQNQTRQPFLHFFLFFFFAECDTSIIHNIPKYKISLVNARERFLFY